MEQQPFTGAPHWTTVSTSLSVRTNSDINNRNGENERNGKTFSNNSIKEEHDITDKDQCKKYKKENSLRNMRMIMRMENTINKIIKMRNHLKKTPDYEESENYNDEVDISIKDIKIEVDIKEEVVISIKDIKT